MANVVTAIEVKFHTNDDDKDFDTVLTTDFRCGNSVFATNGLQSPYVKTSGLAGMATHDAFSDNTDSPWFSIPIQSKVSKAGVHACTTKVRIDPVGHDTWRFNYWVRLHYTDKTMDEYHYDGHWLSEKNRENVFDLK